MGELSWRYLTQVFTEMELQRELDELGSAGWELVTAHWEPFSLGGRSHMQARCILKRPMAEDQELDQPSDRYESMALR